MNITGSGFNSIEQITGQYLSDNKVREVERSEGFKDVLEVTFSKHATKRLTDRNIDLTPEQLYRLQAGADKSRANGIKESLLIMDDMAFIVNTKNSTVVTAIDNEDSKDRVYTNIDGAVIV